MGGAYENILYEEETGTAFIDDDIINIKVKHPDDFNAGDELEVDGQFCANGVFDDVKYKAWVVDKKSKLPTFDFDCQNNCANVTDPIMYRFNGNCYTINQVRQIVYNLTGNSAISTNLQVPYESVGIDHSVVSYNEKFTWDNKVNGVTVFGCDQPPWSVSYSYSSAKNVQDSFFECQVHPSYAGTPAPYTSPYYVLLTYTIRRKVSLDLKQLAIQSPGNNLAALNYTVAGPYLDLVKLTIRIPTQAPTNYYNFPAVLLPISSFGPIFCAAQDHPHSVTIRTELEHAGNGASVQRSLYPEVYLLAKVIRKNAQSIYPASNPVPLPTKGQLDNVKIKVVRSGKRNQLNETVQEFSMLSNPVNNNHLAPAFNDIINAGARQYVESASVPQNLDNPANTIYYNEFVIGKRGNYRPWIQVLPQVMRNYPTSTPDKLKGTYAIHPYWDFYTFSPQHSILNKMNGTLTLGKWYEASKVHVFSPYGNDLEVGNAAGIHNAVLTGYNHKLPVATVTNCAWNGAMFENFEDFKSLFALQYMQFYQNGFKAFLKGQLPNTQLNGSGIEMSTAQAHTGKYSLLAKSTFSYNLPVVANAGQLSATYLMPFSLVSSNKYIVSCWQYTGNTAPPAVSSLRLNGLAGLLRQKSPAVDGWVLYEGEITIPANVSSVPLSVNTANVYLDDIRILPASSNMKAYVYDAQYQRLVATLDENHMSTRFEYSAEGKLARIKKETEKGIVTLKESRQSLKSTWSPFNPAAYGGDFTDAQGDVLSTY